MKHIIIIGMCALVWALPVPGYGELYIYKDKHGRLMLTNVLKEGIYSRFKEHHSDYKWIDGSEDEYDGWMEIKEEQQNMDAISKNAFKYDPIIRDAASVYKIEFELIKAIIEVESNFDANAESEKGAQGLMQLMPATAEELGVKDPFDPRENIFGGTRYLRQLLDRFDYDMELVLAAYNAGPNLVEKTVRKTGAIPRIEETRLFINDVLAIQNGYREENEIDNTIRTRYENGRYFIYNAE